MKSAIHEYLSSIKGMSKSLINTTIVIFFSLQLFAQEIRIETQSIMIDDLISFVVENYDADDSELRNIAFLIQTNDNKVGIEDKIILKQAFKIISDRLNEESRLSLITYFKFNGVALKPTSPKELKLILHTLNDLKGSIPQFYKDGIQLAYSHTEQNYIEDAENSVVMIRIENKAENEVLTVKDEKKKESKKKKDVLLATAIGLLPEIISLIKD